ncbi:MAG TPA: hypothetical protein VF750_08695 [Sphingomicrobium sp.]
MRPSLRFLTVAVIGWAGVRAAALGALPGKDWFQFAPAPLHAQPVAQTDFPEIEPVEPAGAIGEEVAAAANNSPAPGAITLPAGAANVQYVQGSVGVPVPMRPGVVTVYRLPEPRPAAVPVRQAALPAEYDPLPPRGYSRLPSLEEDPLLRLASLSPTSRPHVIVDNGMPPPPTPPLNVGIDRLQLSSWALLRSQQTGIAGSQSLASGGGQLGASQAGARLLFNLNRQIAFAARVSSPVGRRGGELAAGVRVRPLVSIPVWVTAERRQMIGKYGGGRNDFALYAEGGVYEMPLPWQFSLDSYFQGGVVGIQSRDPFFDGSFTMTRPLFRNFSAGFGVWGGVQPGLSRLDVGPRVTMKVRKNLKVHLDWRQKLIGNARPGSGPALTLAGDF